MTWAAGSAIPAVSSAARTVASMRKAYTGKSRIETGIETIPFGAKTRR